MRFPALFGKRNCRWVLPQGYDGRPLALLSLLGGHKAELFVDVEATKVVQYHFLMIVRGVEDEVRLVTASEWTYMVPASEQEPRFVVYDERGCETYEASPRWTELAPFVLRSVQAFRERCADADAPRCAAEIWTLSRTCALFRRFCEPAPSGEEAAVGVECEGPEDSLLEYFSATVADCYE